jgi:hypothetical protein
MLVKLLRLNVPCSSGGFIRFNKTVSLCGKLEEMSESQRTLYFHSYATTSFSILGYPKFHFTYKLVDYCYNVTLTNQNTSFVIQPTYLCHFKIHLPFGNEISLKLRLNGATGANANIPTVTRTVHMTSAKNDRYSILDFAKMTNELESYDRASAKCVGISIEIINRANERWSECVGPLNSQKNIEFNLKISDNVLFIRIAKQEHRASLNDVNGGDDHVTH